VPDLADEPTLGSGKPANLRAEVRPLSRPTRIVLVALGAVSGRLVGAVRAALKENLLLDAAPGPALERPRYAFNEARRQYHTAAILRRLSALRPGRERERAPVLGLADAGVDLFLPDASYVIGDADRDAGAALVSTARLATRDLERLAVRASVEAVHEAGHLLGLGHCLDFRCAMFLSREPAEVDRKGAGLCHGCRVALGLEH
jgi:archaemetzincin